MVVAMREDWDRTDRLPVAAAHASHHEFAGAKGFRDSTAADLASHRTDVIARAHRQLGDELPTERRRLPADTSRQKRLAISSAP